MLILWIIIFSDVFIFLIKIVIEVILFIVMVVEIVLFLKLLKYNVLVYCLNNFV